MSGLCVGLSNRSKLPYSLLVHAAAVGATPVRDAKMQIPDIRSKNKHPHSNIVWPVYEITELPSPWTGRIIGKQAVCAFSFLGHPPSTPHVNVDETRPSFFYSFHTAWRGSTPQH